MSKTTVRLARAAVLAAVLAVTTSGAALAHLRSSQGPRPSPGPRISGPTRVAPRGTIGGSRVIIAPFDPVDRWFWGPRLSLWFAWGWPGPWGYGPLYPPAYGYTRMIPGDWAAVELHVHPWKASVRIDGDTAGQARDFNSYYDPLWLKPGRHVLELSYPGYMTLRTNLRVREGAYFDLRYSLEEGEGLDPRSDQVAATPKEERAPSRENERGRAPAWYDGGQERGMLRIEAGPADAVVYLDGDFLGRADELDRLHGPVPVTPGRHRVEVVRPGYDTRAVEVEVASGETRRVQVDLQKAGG
jgi:PEGA domain